MIKHRYIFTVQKPGKYRTYTHTEAVIETSEECNRRRAQEVAERHYDLPAGYLDNCEMSQVDFNDKTFEG